jgi:hypothetical protein
MLVKDRTGDDHTLLKDHAPRGILANNQDVDSMARTWISNIRKLENENSNKNGIEILVVML